jgi:hypothetical protein
VGEDGDGDGGSNSVHRGLLMECSGALYPTLVTNRLQLAIATVEMGLNDDCPFEDNTQLQEHVRRGVCLAFTHGDCG